MLRSERESQTNLQGLAASTSQSLQSQTVSNPENRLPLNRLESCSRATKQIAHCLDKELTMLTEERNERAERLGLRALIKQPLREH